jgi:hypothetical protein
VPHTLEIPAWLLLARGPANSETERLTHRLADLSRLQPYWKIPGFMSV